ncbi:MAG: hypothetical protein ACQERC_07250 [Bacteroidota bacterium]
MKVIYTIVIFLLLFSCNTSNNHDTENIEKLKAIYKHNDSITDKVLNTPFAKYDRPIHNGIRTLRNLRGIRKLYESKLIQSTNSKSSELSIDKISNDLSNKKINKSQKEHLERVLKYSALGYDEYYKLEMILEKNIDTVSTHEILTKYKQFEQASVEKIIRNYAERVKEVTDLCRALLFIEEFHSKLINSIIKDNSLNKTSIGAGKNNKVRISAQSQPYKDDSVKIFLLFNDSIRGGEDIFYWGTSSHAKKMNQYIGENIIVSKEHDSIYGESPIYKNDTVYWKPWAVSTSVMH